MWLLPQHHAIAVSGCIAVLLAACATPHTLATFRTGEETISLERSAEGGKYSVTVGPGTSLSLDNYTSAHIDSIWNIANAHLIVITGTSADCHMRYALVIAAADTARLHSIGECGDAYSFAQDGDAVAIRQTGVENSTIWTFRDGVLDGPTVEVAHISRHRRHAASPHLIEHASGAASSPEPPAVSPPVGDEVIPPPVGRSASSGNQKNDAPLF
jgi:hypothetical protein